MDIANRGVSAWQEDLPLTVQPTMEPSSPRDSRNPPCSNLHEEGGLTGTVGGGNGERTGIPSGLFFAPPSIPPS